MTARYLSYHLGNLTDGDALAAVYNYANLLKIEVTDIFEIVFRNIYEAEISEVGQEKIQKDIMRQLTAAKGQVAYYKGIVTEYRVINRFLAASQKGKPLAEIVIHAEPGIPFGPFRSLKKRTFQIDQEKKVEADIWCEATSPEGVDFMVKVKDWDTRITDLEIQDFITKKNLVLSLSLKRTAFIFYSERGLSEAQIRWLAENGIMVTDSGRLCD